MTEDWIKGLQAKNAKQREEIARLTRKVETLRKEVARMRAFEKWMRGEDDD